MLKQGNFIATVVRYPGRKSSIIFLGISLAFTLSTSCKEEVLVEEICIPSERLLLRNYKETLNPDSVFLSVKTPYYDIVKAISQKMGKDYCEESGLIQLSLEEWKEPLWFNALVIPECDDNVISCGYLVLDVLINVKSQVLLDGHLSSLDSLRIDLVKETIKFATEFGKDIDYSIQWDPGIPQDSLLFAFEQIVLGQKDAGDSISLRNFGKLLCDLDSSEQIELFSHYRPVLSFTEYKPIPPPPPPPPTYNIEDEISEEVYLDSLKE